MSRRLRILYIGDFGFDVLSQSLFSGLVECGADVVDFPHNPLLHDGVETWDREELRRLVAARPPAWFPPVEDEVDLGAAIASGSLAPQSSQRQYTQVRSAPEASERDVLGLLSAGAFDLAVLVVGYLRSRQALVAVARLADRAALPPLIMADLSRRPDAVRWDLAEVLRPVAVFKNLVTAPDPRVAPLPLSSPIAGKGRRFLRGMFGARFDPDGPKRYDVHCNLSPTYAPRAALSAEVDRLCRERGWTRAPAGPYGENLLAVHESRIAFTMRGSEPDTLHYWEIPSFRTAMFCDGTMGVVHPDPFRDGETAVFYDPEDLSSLGALLGRYLGDDEARLSVAVAGRRHCARRHSNRARARYFLDVVLGRLAAPAGGRPNRTARNP